MTSQPDARTCQHCRHSDYVATGKRWSAWFRVCQRERPFRVVRDDDPACEHYEARRRGDYSGGYHATEEEE